MITVTEGAKKVLRDILLAKVDNYYAFLRLTSPQEGQVGLGIDIELPGDKVVEYEGTKLLLVEHNLAESLEGMMLATDNTPEGPQLVIVSPS
ncbi:MAG: hypothetical protein HY325_05285 [Chloroflexi bacterium]|nr:hypothetical protein [Chloroflexota bacterium]